MDSQETTSATGGFQSVLSDTVGSGKVLCIGERLDTLASAFLQAGECELFGIELGRGEASEDTRFRALFGADALNDLSERFSAGEFRTVVIQDALEQSADPQRLLEQLRRLAPEHIVLCAPNPMSALSLTRLFTGQNFVGAGRRVFTKRDLLELLEACGFVVERVLRTPCGETSGAEMLPPEVAKFISEQHEAATESYMFIARAAEGAKGSFLAAELRDEVTALRASLGELNSQLREREERTRELESELAGYRKDLSEHGRQLEARAEEVAWYTKKLKESLLSFYTLKEKEEALQQLTEERAKLAAELEGVRTELTSVRAQHDSLAQERHIILTELMRLQKYAPDRLPRLIKLPLKALITTFCDGPLEPIRVLQKKKLGNISPLMPSRR